MNIQIFGRSKCFDTKKAERWFKERRVRFQSVDVVKYGMSRGELSSVKNAVGLEARLASFPAAGLGPGQAGPAVGGPDHAAYPHRAKRQAGHGGLLSRGVGRLGVNSPLYGTQVPVC